MNQIFNDVSVNGIIKPGYSYVFTETSGREWSTEPIEYIFCIKEEKEILPALDMEFSIILAEDYELRKFLGIRKVNNNCHEFKVLCYDKDSEKERKHSRYLHRFYSFEEYLRKVKKLFLEESNTAG